MRPSGAASSSRASTAAASLSAILRVLNSKPAANPEAYVYLRSSAKPFQALPLVLSGAADAFGLTDEELAVACASHNAEELHLAAVRSILEKAGLGESDLQSPTSPPSGPSWKRPGLSEGRPAERRPPADVRTRGRGACPSAERSRVRSTATAPANTPACSPSAPTRATRRSTYREPGHPLQRRILGLIAEICGLQEDEILVAGDNCGVPAFALPLRSFATGLARIATTEELPDELVEAALRIRDAMRAHPFMVAGTGRFDTELMERTRLLVKGGAEAVLAVGNPEGWGMALKISDGSHRAVRPAALAALENMGVGVGDGETVVRGLHGEEVGEIGPLI